jgi:acetylornithine deacetylase/succinyl-diaminopimelate desuccinylase-like protein
MLRRETDVLLRFQERCRTTFRKDGREMNWNAVLDETVGLLRDLIRFDTTNPPGNELPAAEYLRDLMEGEGIPAEVLVSEGRRGSVVARLKGDGGAEPLLLLGHLDVVPVERAMWSVEPFEGVIKDGAVYGRGALDMKGMVAVEAAVFLALKRQGIPLRRDLIFAAVADEETGGAKGAEWLVREHWDKVAAGYVLNEGGGGLLMNGLPVFHCQAAEKGICWAKMRARGAGGHGSMPHADNPTVVLAEAIVRLGAYIFPPTRNSITELALERLERAGLLPTGMTAEAALSDEEEVGRRLLKEDHRVSAMIRNTATPTVVRGGSKTNVIPQEALVELDCRAFPEMKPSDVLNTVREIASDPRLEFEIIRDTQGSGSPIDTDLWRAIESSLKSAQRGVIFLPYQSPGGTDSGFFRRKGAVCYGVDPFFLTEAEWDSVHGNDERVRIESLDWGLKWVYSLVKGFCEA